MENNFNTSEIMTVSELAKYLKISERTVMRLLKKGEIPASKVAGQWRFLKSVIDEWLITNMQKGKTTSFSSLIETGEVKIKLSRIIHPSLIILDLPSGGKVNILKELITPLVKLGYINEPKKYLDLLIEREQMVSTALSNGIAVPHIRNLKDNPFKDPVVVLGISKDGVNFDSLDGEKTHLFFLICSNNDITHLKILAKINALAHNKNLVYSIVNANSIAEVISLISSFDAHVKHQ